MRVSIVGTGYVGSVTGACLAHLGNEITFIDIDPNKLNLIQKGKAPIFEPGLDELIAAHQERIAMSDSIEDILPLTDCTIICVGTPTKLDGSIDLSAVREVGAAIGLSLQKSRKFHTVIMKSTVLPGTIEGIVLPILESRSGKRAFFDFGLGSNPEFLREGNAVYDFFHPDRIIFGAQDMTTQHTLEELYQSLQAPKIITPIKSAEMIKYVSNAFLATKISFSNEIGNLCKKIGVDSYEVFHAVGLDQRIGPHFFRSGVGYGGSCLPKDLRAFITFAGSFGVGTQILNAVVEVNERQPRLLVDLLRQHLPLAGSTIGILGLTFKPETDDIRESRAIPIIQDLLKEGAHIIAYDPLGMDSIREKFPSLTFVLTPEEVLQADATLILTEWKEFENLDYSGKIIIDGRRIKKAQDEATIYEGLCW